MNKWRVGIARGYSWRPSAYWRRFGWRNPRQRRRPAFRRRARWPTCACWPRSRARSPAQRTPRRAQHILAQLRAIGLQPEVQTAMAQKNTMDRRRNMQVVLGMVNNIVVHMPGTAPDHAQAPGAAAGRRLRHHRAQRRRGGIAAPVAAMLESLRVLQAGAPLANDLVVLFADGERVGGLGARAFAGQHPLAKRIGLAMRFDSAGSGGPLVLIGASGNDLGAIRGWAHAAPQPDRFVGDGAAGTVHARGALRHGRARHARQRAPALRQPRRQQRQRPRARATPPTASTPAPSTAWARRCWRWRAISARPRRGRRAGRRRSAVLQRAGRRRGQLFGGRGVGVHAAGLPAVADRLLHGVAPRRRHAARNHRRRARLPGHRRAAGAGGAAWSGARCRRCIPATTPMPTAPARATTGSWAVSPRSAPACSC